MVQAAPNATTIRFRVLETTPDPNTPEKALLKIEVLPAETHHDQRFIKPGATMEAFTFDKTTHRKGDIFMADAEYIGGPKGGFVHLKHLQTQ